MREELEKLENRLKRIKIKKIPTTFLSIINKKFDEVTISRCVAFLINPEYTTLNIIGQLLNITQQEEDEADFIQLFNNEDTVFEGIEVEEVISSRSRIDIIIRFSTFWILIENKINSYENNEQTLRYEKDLDQKEKPVKYICLKPQYNKSVMKNKKFSYVLYNQLVEILKTVTKYDLKEQENYCYIEDFIKHMEGFLMKENELEISEDVEFYIENREVIEGIVKNYDKQCELVKDKLVDCIKNKFGNEYNIYATRTYFQIWKDSWDNTQHKGIHYEIYCDTNKIIGCNRTVNFTIHNEEKTRKIYSDIEHMKSIKKQEYKFDNSKNIENSIKQIVDEMYRIAEEYNSDIDEKILAKK